MRTRVHEHHIQRRRGGQCALTNSHYSHGGRGTEEEACEVPMHTHTHARARAERRRSIREITHKMCAYTQGGGVSQCTHSHMHTEGRGHKQNTITSTPQAEHNHAHTTYIHKHAHTTGIAQTHAHRKHNTSIKRDKGEGKRQCVCVCTQIIHTLSKTKKRNARQQHNNKKTDKTSK